MVSRMMRLRRRDVGLLAGGRRRAGRRGARRLWLRRGLGLLGVDDDGDRALLVVVVVIGMQRASARARGGSGQGGRRTHVVDGRNLHHGSEPAVVDPRRVVRLAERGAHLVVHDLCRTRALRRRGEGARRRHSQRLRKAEANCREGHTIAPWKSGLEPLLTLAWSVNCDTAGVGRAKIEGRSAIDCARSPARACGGRGDGPQRIDPPTSLTDARQASPSGLGQSRSVRILLTSVFRSSDVSSVRRRSRARRGRRPSAQQAAGKGSRRRARQQRDRTHPCRSR